MPRAVVVVSLRQRVRSALRAVAFVVASLPALATMAVTVAASEPGCTQSVVAPPYNPAIGPLSSASEINCTTANQSSIASTERVLQMIGSDWPAVAGSASQQGIVGCCAYAEDVNAYLSAVPAPSIADSNTAYTAFVTFRTASCGGACMRTGSGCL